jgi:hypothetical protein
MRRLTIFVLFTLFTARPTLAADGIVLMQRMTGAAGSVVSQIQLEPNRARTEVTDPSGRRQIVIFDGALDTLLIVDPANKRYTEVTRADAARLGGMVQGAMAMMQEQLARMPPEQRKAMEAKMGALMGPLATASTARPTFKRVGTGQAGTWTCERYDGYLDAKKISEICTVSPQALGATAADFAVLARMVDFVRVMVPQLADQLVGVGTPEAGFSGIPVRMMSSIGPTPSTVEVTEVRRETFADALFTVPAGFERVALPGQ